MAHGRRGGFAKKIDTVHWDYQSFEFISQAAGTAGALLAAAQHLPETLMRMRGEWVSTFSATAASGLGVAVTVGIIQVPEGTGSTVLWSPITDGNAPWIWWDTFHLIYQELVTDVVAAQPAMAGRRVIDSKAMRKLRNTELQVVIENATISGLTGASVHAVGSLRFLAGS